MKILLYNEPATIFYLPHPITKVLQGHLYTWITKTISKKVKVEIKTILPEIAFIQNEKSHNLDMLNPINFCDSYLYEIFPDALSMQEIYLKIFNNDLKESEHSKFREIMQNLLKDWKPDIIITFPNHNPLFKKTYPDALCLLTENGIFSRPPFERVLRFDPIHHANGFPNKFEAEIRNFKITDKQRESVHKFKKELKKSIELYNPIKNKLSELKKKYRYMLLLPVPANNIYKETKYDDQYFYVLDILNKIPKDVGLILTFHDDINAQLNKNTIKLLQEKYPNVICFPPEDNSYVSQSLNYFAWADAIINMSTMTGTQAMLWDLKVISLDKTYSKWFSDKEGLENLEEFLALPKKDNSNIIYWYMTHFCIFQKRFNEPNWYYNYFKQKLKNYKSRGMTFDLFEQIEDFDELSDYILSSVKHNMSKQEKINNNLTFLQKIFSIINYQKHKVITILGINIVMPWECSKKDII